MAVITISNELGSGGVDIGQRVAKSLGYEFVDKRTSDSILRQYGLTKFNEVYSSAPSILDLLNSDNLLIVSMLNEILEALAKRGRVVILGRAEESKVSLLVSVTGDLVARVHAGNLVRRLAELVGGGGGGRPDMAEAGGRKPELLDEAIRKGVEDARQTLLKAP